jgi:E1-like protein-activating enzyme Gsa7p/Apg7p
MPSVLTIQEFSLCVDISFWMTLLKRIIDKKIDNTSTLYGYYTSAMPNSKKSIFVIETESFEKKSSENDVRIEGQLYLFDTLTSFNDSINKSISKNNETNLFSLYVFADIKTHNFSYRFDYEQEYSLDSTKLIQNYENAKLTFEELSYFVGLYKKYVTDYKTIHSCIPPYFIGYVNDLNLIDVCPHTLKELADATLKIDATILNNLVICIIDPCSLPNIVGEPVFKAILDINKKLFKKTLNVMCLRDINHFTYAHKYFSSSPFLNISLEQVENSAKTITDNKIQTINLQNLLNPHQLMKLSSDLNLKLMRWRLWPSLNLEQIAKQKCLLIGAGTLGCNVGRNLLAWGITNITFIDNSTVSYSNPLRQCLYDYSDTQGSKMKAVTAAAKLKQITPLVESVGHNLSIPMPGHWSESEDGEIRNNIHKLFKLILEHDVIFVLTDTRESRWLPILLIRFLNKVGINVGLGFDSYLVQNQLPQSESGCYYCTDIVAPTDSVTKRSVDQKCTITRPGVAPIASAIAVEMMIDILQKESVLKSQIRGCVKDNVINKIDTARYHKCICCSNAVQESFFKGGEEWIVEMIKNPESLEELTGLKEINNNLDKIIGDFECED